MKIWRRIGLAICWACAAGFLVDTMARIGVYVPEFVRWYPEPPPGHLTGLAFILFLAVPAVPVYLVSEHERRLVLGQRTDWGAVFRQLAALLWTWFLWTAIVANGLQLLDAHLSGQPLDVALALKRVAVMTGGLPWWGLKLIAAGMEPFRLLLFTAGVILVYGGLAPLTTPREWLGMALLGGSPPRRKEVAAVGQPGVQPQARPQAQPQAPKQPPGQAAQPKPQPRPRNLRAFDSLIGLDEPIRVLREALEVPIVSPELVKSYRLEVPRGLLMEGPPGTGKTSLARAAAAYFGCAFREVSLPETLSKFVGQSEGNLHGYFVWAKQNAPAILFFDEIDSIAKVRDDRNLNRAQDILLNVLLEELDGFHGRQGVFVMAATNRVDVLDPAVLRPGRFDRVVHIGLPGKEARKRLFALYLRGRPLDPKVSFDLLAERTEGKSPAEIKAVCDRAAWNAAYKVLGELDNPGASADVLVKKTPLTPEDFPV